MCGPRGPIGGSALLIAANQGFDLIQSDAQASKKNVSEKASKQEECERESKQEECERESKQEECERESKQEECERESKQEECERESKQEECERESKQANVSEKASKKNVSEKASKKNVSEKASKKNQASECERESKQANVSEKASKKNVSEKASKKNVSEKASKKNVSEKASKKNVSEKASKKNVSEKASKKNVSEKASKKNVSEKASKKNVSEKASKKNVSEKASKKNVSEKASKQECESKREKKREQERFHQGEMRHLEVSVVLPLCITFLLVSSVTLELFYVILTTPGKAQRPLLVLATYLLLNVAGNILKFLQSNSTIKGVFLEHGIVGQGWIYCYSCQTHVPPRCHHCYNCNVCVLRRDHHCTLLGKCVGFANYRYFVCALLHAWLALLLATILNVDIFMELLHEGVSVHSFLLLIMPWMMLIIGQVKASTFIFAFVADTCVVGFAFCFAFLTLHCLLIYRGSTMKEWFGGHAREYDHGWRRNVRHFLGERWHLVWLSPWIESTLPGDGIHFEPRNPSASVTDKKSDQ
ncbi:putative palmitoyltransferase ZDHHC24 [Gastrophryne carolinensis]